MIYAIAAWLLFGAVSSLGVIVFKKGATPSDRFGYLINAVLSTWFGLYLLQLEGVF